MGRILVNPNAKPKYKVGEWVKFSKGGRTLRGCIGWRYYDNFYGSWVYDIGRNKQTFSGVYEGKIIEYSPQV